MTACLIDNVQVMAPGRGIIGRSLLIDHAKVAAIDPPTPPAHTTCIDGQGGLLTPGLIDLHCHGIQHHLFEAGQDAMRAALTALPRFGTTTVLPTLYTVMHREALGQLRSLARAMDEPCGAIAPGLHLEGPFLKLAGAGAATLAGDLSLLEDLLAAAEGRVAAMSVSPDTPGILAVIEALAGHNIAVFMTHTAASYEQTRDAIAAGARHATHFYNVFPTPPMPEPGVRAVGAVEAILEDPRVTVDFIVDGAHVHPGVVRMALACKGPDKVCAITDANIGAGLPAGSYPTPWGFPVRVRPGDGARNDDPAHPNYNTLAGSSLTMDQAFANLRQWLDRPAHEVLAMVTANPARVIGAYPDLGSLAPGTRADLVLWNASGTPQRTWVGGEQVFIKETGAAS